MMTDQPQTYNDLAHLATRITLAADEAAPPDIDPRITRRILTAAFRELGKSGVSLAARLEPTARQREGRLVFPTAEQLAKALEVPLRIPYGAPEPDRTRTYLTPGDRRVEMGVFGWRIIESNGDATINVPWEEMPQGLFPLTEE